MYVTEWTPGFDSSDVTSGQVEIITTANPKYFLYYHYSGYFYSYDGVAAAEKAASFSAGDKLILAVEADGFGGYRVGVGDSWGATKDTFAGFGNDGYMRFMESIAWPGTFGRNALIHNPPASLTPEEALNYA